jgi:hypothetical protein
MQDEGSVAVSEGGTARVWLAENDLVTLTSLDGPIRPIGVSTHSTAAGFEEVKGALGLASQATVSSDSSSITGSEAFPVPYLDDFESSNISQPGRYWYDEMGAFEIAYESGRTGNKVLRQVVTIQPMIWNDAAKHGPQTFLGDGSFSTHRANSAGGGSDGTGVKLAFDLRLEVDGLQLLLIGGPFFVVGTDGRWQWDPSGGARGMNHAVSQMSTGQGVTQGKGRQQGICSGMRVNEWSRVEYMVTAEWAAVALGGKLLVNDTSYRCRGAWKLTLRLSRYAPAAIDNLAISRIR